MGQQSKAMSAYEKALELDANCSEAMEGVFTVQCACIETFDTVDTFVNLTQYSKNYPKLRTLKIRSFTSFILEVGGGLD